MAERMSKDDCRILGELIRKYLQLAYVSTGGAKTRLVSRSGEALSYIVGPEDEGTKAGRLVLRNTLRPLRELEDWKVTKSRSRKGRWGVSPATASRIANGQRSVAPDLALRILVDIRPNRTDTSLFLR